MSVALERSTVTPPPPPPPPPEARPLTLAQAGPVAQQPAPPPPATQTARTEIDRRLDGTGFLGAQTNGDVKAIADTLRGLSPADAATVIRGLETDGRLDDVASGITSAGTFTSGLSADERGQFFADMAGRLDGASLASLSRAFGGLGGDRSTEGAGYVRELGSAVATHGTPQAKIDFVRALGPDTVAPGRDSQFENGLLSRTTYEGNAQARAVGDVLSSMRGTQLQTAFNSLDANQQRAVFQASIGETATHFTGQGSPHWTPGYDTAQFGRLADALATMPDAHQKAQAFAVGADVLRGERPAPGTALTGANTSEAQRATAEMGQALGRILDTDPARIVNDLATFRQVQPGTGDVATANGNALATYARQMLESGQGANGVLGAQLARVAAGSEGLPTKQEAFDHSVGGQYRTANALGYFIGATAAAAQSINGDQASQNALIGNALASGLTLLDKSGIAATAAAVAKDWIRTAQTSLAGAGATSPVQALTDAATPVNAAGYDSANSDALSAFRSQINFIAANARP